MDKLTKNKKTNGQEEADIPLERNCSPTSLNRHMEESFFRKLYR